MAKSSFVERNKAVREAWTNELLLVQEGSGTRDWTPEQQKDILEKGRAYDENGNAFEGQHMKSAEEYPEYQGNPKNIQFLTRAEHFEAHDRNWQNPTNWYYNPMTKEKISFGEGPFIPCEVIYLSNPVVDISNHQTNNETLYDEATKSSTQSQNEITEKTNMTSTHSKSNIVTNTPKDGLGDKIYSGFKKIGKAIIEFPVKHPTATKVLKIASFIALTGAAKAISDSSKSNSTHSDIKYPNNSCTDNDIDYTSNDSDELDADTDDLTESSYTPNDVPAGKQRYHYKDGSVKWKDKQPYHRGDSGDE